MRTVVYITTYNTATTLTDVIRVEMNAGMIKIYHMNANKVEITEVKNTEIKSIWIS